MSRPRYGDQRACTKCGHDIEWTGKRHRRNDGTVLAGIMDGGWRDRGNGDECLPTGGYDRNGDPIPTPRGLHRGPR